MKNRFHTRGLALIMTLMVAMLLVVLVSAFITVNRSNSAITANLVTRQDAYNACLSGLHYAWAQLEANQLWGVGGFPATIQNFSFPLSNPKVRIRIHGDPENPEDLTANRVEGEMVGSADRFTLKLVNNIQSRHVIEDTELGDIPGRTARLEVTGTSNKITLRLQAVLRKKPYVDYSALSRDTLEVELQSNSVEAWGIRSKDPYVNQVRSNTSILGPSAVDEHLKFREPPRGGVAMAKDEIMLGGSRLSSSPSLLEQSQEASKGSFQIGTPEVEVPDLGRENLNFPTHNLSIPGGTLEFSLYERHEWTPKVFFEGSPSEVTRWRKQVYLHNGIQHNTDHWVGQTARLEEDSGEIVTVNDGFPAPTSENGFINPLITMGDLNDFPVLYQSDEDHRISANLQTGEIAMTPATTFNVEGDLTIIQDEGALQPHLLMAHVMELNGDMTFRGGEDGIEALNDPASNSTALTTTGHLSIDGIITGFGSIYSDESVSFRAKSGLRADLDLAVAVHGEQIRFEPENRPGPGTKNTLLDADYLAFKSGLGPSSAQYDFFEKFWEEPQHTKEAKIGVDPASPGGVRNKVLEHDANYYWARMKEDLELGDAPDFGAPPFGSPQWSGPITLDEYVRLREYATEGDTSWLIFPQIQPDGTVNKGPRYDAVTGKINESISSYSRWANAMFDGEHTMSQYMTQESPLVADVFFVGLVHAGGGGFVAEANRNSMLFEGAVVSQGRLSIRDTPGVDFVYNRLYLDDVVRQYFGESIQLDQVYYKIQ